MKATLTFFILGLSTAVFALPDAVLEACFSPTLTDHISGKTWQVTSQEQWENSPLAISELGGVTTAKQAGNEHPDGWVKTEVTLVAPPQTATTPCPTQTFTIKALPVGITPKTTLTFTFLNQAQLPPHTVRTWQGFPALVSKANDWYIIAQDAKAVITTTNKAPVKTTLAVPNCSSEKTTPLSQSILVGEGPLPSEPKTK